MPFVGVDRRPRSLTLINIKHHYNIRGKLLGGYYCALFELNVNWIGKQDIADEVAVECNVNKRLLSLFLVPAAVVCIITPISLLQLILRLD